MEIEPALRRVVLDDPTLRGYVQDRAYAYRLEEHVDQTGQRAIVIARSGGWAQPDRVKTPEFPLVTIEFWADCTRDRRPDGSVGEKRAEDALRNAWALYRAWERLARTLRTGQRWGAVGSDPGLLVVGMQRWAEPSHYDADTPDGTKRQFGEAAMVRGQWAFQVSHGRD